MAIWNPFTEWREDEEIPIEEFLREHNASFLGGKSVQDLGITTVAIKKGRKAVCVVPSSRLREADSFAEGQNYRPATLAEFFGLLGALSSVDFGQQYYVVHRVSEEYWHMYSVKKRVSGTVRKELVLFAKASSGAQLSTGMPYCAIYVKNNNNHSH